MNRIRVLSLPLVFLASCAQVRQEEYYVHTMNTHELEIPCVIYVEDVLMTGRDGQPLKTPARVTIKFTDGTGGPELGSMKLAVKAVKVDEEGKITSGIRRGELSEYNEDWRPVYPSDAKRQTFILSRRRN